MGRDPRNTPEYKELGECAKMDLKEKNRITQTGRGEAKGWVGNALDDCVNTRESIVQRGIGNHFFAKSLEKPKQNQGGI